MFFVGFVPCFPGLEVNFMQTLIDLLYVPDDPMQTLVRILFLVIALDFFAVICSYLGGLRK